MPEYNKSRFDPPAPIARAALRNPSNRAVETECDLLIDSGADATLLPLFALVPLEIQPIADTRYAVMAFDGTRSEAPVADLDLVFLNRRFRGRYLLIDAEVGVLGRDVLNHLALLLDGPAQRWSEHSP
jgi:hypothetical protein